ncbi:hypothetical protein EDF24_1298 [Curtobacterium sp. PhB130]|uniref:hypothetical protein n=1 Tax=Curtobacterium sp. PhB130 TaxID=2485178 RepID=UPI000FB0DACF|nr:hypothetical protein [Curtobacterium sp. PhB130]ROS75727.1 hypothetical protein EDF24_1298 [Curtobacterium sp. PhB130]
MISALVLASCATANTDCEDTMSTDGTGMFVVIVVVVAVVVLFGVLVMGKGRGRR